MNNSTETETFKYNGYASPFKYIFSNNAIQNEYETTTQVAGTLQMVIGGNANAIQSTNAPSTVIVGGNGNTITTRHNNKGFGTAMLGGNGNTIGSSEDTIANFGSVIVGGNASKNNGNFCGILAASSSLIRYAGDPNNSITSAVIAGGNENTISNIGNFCFIGGGQSNLCQMFSSAVIGGGSNQITNTATTVASSTRFAAIIAGSGNTLAMSNNSVIVGGQNSTITNRTNVVMLGTSGRTATTNNATFVEDLVIFDYPSLNYIDDTAAAAGGVVLGQVYHNNGALRIRIV
jgi:hypothetical protein